MRTSAAAALLLSVLALGGCSGGGSASDVASATVLTAIEVNPLNPHIAMGSSVSLSATAIYSDNTHADVTGQVSWSSSNTTVTVVNAAAVKGIGLGTATVSASLQGVAGTTSVTVTSAALVSIAVTPPIPSIALGTGEQFAATGTYTDDSTQDLTNQVTWVSSDTAVATISNATGTKGRATSAGTGGARISASLGSVSSAPVTLTVTGATLVSIALTPPAPSIALGTAQQFMATGTYTDNTTQDLTTQVNWGSNNSLVAAISNAAGSQGLASAVGTGSAHITAAVGSVTSPAATLTVTAATLASIAVTPPSRSIALGTSEQFTATGTYTNNTTHDLTAQVTWNSNNTSVANISNSSGSQGLATGDATGTTHITAMLGAVTSPYVVLTVSSAALVSIAVTPASPSIALGTTEQFTATGTYTDNSTQDLTSQVTWGSGNAAVAGISNANGTRGLATSIATGNAHITAMLGAVTSPYVTLTVTSATLVSIAVTPPSPSIALGTTEPFTATGTYTDNSTQDLTNSVTWALDNAYVATISNAAGSQGLATSAASGSAHVTARLGSVTSPYATLTVTPATLVSVAVTPPGSSIASGTNAQFAATGTYTDNSTQDLTSSVTWASDNPTVAAISNVSGSQGLASGAATGSAQITAALGTVHSQPVTLTVTPATLVSIAVTPPNPSVALGTTAQFTATGTYTDNSTQNLTNSVTWASDSNVVATISSASGSQGLASSAATGSAHITAALGAVHSQPVTLTVTPASLVSIAVTPPTTSIALGTTAQFTATGTYTDNSTQNLTNSVTWASDSNVVATISSASGSQGLATSAATGSAHITAALGLVTSSAATLTVTPATLVSIAVTPSSPSIALGTTEQFTATGTYTDNSTQNLTNSVTWASDSNAVATISSASGSQGLASSASTGSAHITASVGLVTSSSATLTVTPATLVSIAVTPTNASIAVGLTQQFTATGTYTDSSTQDLTASVTWGAIGSAATISNAGGSKGRATGASAGSTGIIAGLGAVNSSIVTLTVTPAALVSIAITPTSATVAPSSTQQFSAEGTYTDNSTQNLTNVVTWSSDNSAIASISNTSGTQGLATGIGTGTANISAYFDGVYSSSVALSVSGTASFSTPGSYTWTVPSGVTSIQVVATGGGGGASNGIASGGNGGIVTATIAVNSGDTLQIVVGGGGSNYASGGGGGGGSSSVNAGTTNQIIAGGGGGGGACSGCYGGTGNGGQGGSPFSSYIAYGGSGGTGGGGSQAYGVSGGNGNGGAGGYGGDGAYYTATPGGTGGYGGAGSGTGASSYNVGQGYGGGGGGGYGGGGCSYYGGGGGGGSTGPTGSTITVSSNGGSGNASGGNGSVVITY